MPKKPSMISVSQFGGMRDDVDPKLIEPSEFASAINFNFPDDGTLGLNKILMPALAQSLVINSTTTTSAITINQTTIPVTYADGTHYLGTWGVITIDNEQILFDGVIANQYLNCVRGVNGTSAATHLEGAAVYQGVVAGDGNLGTQSSPSTNIFNYCTCLKNIDGIKQYDFIDTAGVPHSYFVVVSEGMMFLFNTDWTPANIFSDAFHLYHFNWAPLRITAGKVSMQVYAGNLYISNGIDYPVIFYGRQYTTLITYSTSGYYIYFISQMGAPLAINHDIVGAGGNQLLTTYKYKMTYVTAGGEEVIGTEHVVSSYGTGSYTGYVLYLPLGYSGTLSRKIYRTQQGNLSNFYLVTTISDNTTMSYTDITADGSLGSAMPTTVNNACPKPYFWGVANSCLYGAKNDLNPTQVYATTSGIQVFDAANYIEIADQANDNTPVEGIGNDFGTVLVATSKNWYTLTPNQGDATITDVNLTRAFCGVKSGYTIIAIPSYGDITGGLLFVSSYNDVRMMTGMQALPVSISVDNVRTQNYGQNIRGSLILDLVSYTNIDAEYFNYKYHLLLTNNEVTSKYVFDIRTQGWTKHMIPGSNPLVLAVLNLGTADVPNYQLFNGQPTGTIEQEYASTMYYNQNVTAPLVSGYILASSNYKSVEAIRFWIKSYNSYGGTANISVITDDNGSSAITATMTIPAAPFDSASFDSRYFECILPLDFQVVNINTLYRWLQYTIQCTVGSVSLQKVELMGEVLENQEA